MQLLERPTLFDELGGKPIKQFRMSGRITACAKVAGSADDAVRKCICQTRLTATRACQRIVRCDHRLGQFQSPATFAESRSVGG